MTEATLDVPADTTLEAAERRAAAERLLADNVGLVWVVAHKLHRSFPTVDLDDLHAEVRVGFVQAARRFDPNRGVKFGTYATRAGYRSGLEFLRREVARGVKVVRGGAFRRLRVSSLDSVPEGLVDSDAPPGKDLIPDHRDPLPPDRRGVWDAIRPYLTSLQWVAITWVCRDGKDLTALGRLHGVSRSMASLWYNTGLSRLRKNPAVARALGDLL